MTELVTDAAEIAAAHVMDDPHQIEIALRAAAPLIAAEALRQAASEQRKQYAANLIDDLTAMWLEERADELERDAAFTGMVQLGQEIGDE